MTTPNDPLDRPKRSSLAQMDSPEFSDADAPKTTPKPHTLLVEVPEPFREMCPQLERILRLGQRSVTGPNGNEQPEQRRS